MPENQKSDYTTTIELVRALMKPGYDVDAYPDGHSWCVSVTTWPNFKDDLKARGAEIVPQGGDEPRRLVLAVWRSHPWPMTGDTLVKVLDDA